MPNCKYDDPKLCDARHINELETLAQIFNTLSRKSKQEEVLLEVIDALEQHRRPRVGRYRAQGALQDSEPEHRL
jgi:hypothetical protein